MTTARWPNKDPNAVADYEIVWSVFLASDAIASSSWIMPAGLTKDSDTFTSNATVIWLSGGTAEQTYEVTNRIVTLGGRTWDQTMTIKVKEK